MLVKLSKFYEYFILPIHEEDAEKSKILWLMKLRWSFLLFQLLIAIPIVIINWPMPKRISIYFGLGLTVFVFNLFMYAVTKFSKDKFSSHITFFSLVFDLLTYSALCTIVLELTRIPIENLFFLHVVLGAVLLTGSKSLIFYLLAAVLYGRNQYFNYHYFIESYALNGIIFNQVVLFFLWLLSFSLSRYIFGQKDIIATMRINSEKLDRLRAVGALTAGFSHELASPLNSLKLYVEREERKKRLDELTISGMLEAVESCHKVIENINQSQLDGRDYLFQMVSLKRFVSDIIDSWKVEHPNTSVNLLVDSYFEKNKVEIAIVNLSQGLLNLFDNAFEANNDSEIQVEILKDEKRIYFKVSDNGPGFDEKILLRFGEPFVSTKKEGTGLGLYSVMVFVQSLGGAMTINNNKENGAVVEFYFPVRGQEWT